MADKGSSRSSNFLLKPLLRNSSLSQLSDSDERTFSFYIVYAKGGTWSFATVGVIVTTLPPEHASRHSSIKPGSKYSDTDTTTTTRFKSILYEASSLEATNKSARRVLFSDDKTKRKKKSGKGKQKDMPWTLDT
nr:hypothetical protein [Tanacetum cinerariifolium]